MGCARCGNTNPSRPVAPPVNRPGSQVPRPPVLTQAPCANPDTIGEAIKNTINNLRYVPK